MDERKFGSVLTIVLIVLIVIIFGILGYFGYSTYNKSKIQANSDTALKDFKQSLIEESKKPVNDNSNTTNEQQVGDTTNLDDLINKLNPSQTGTNTTTQNPNKPKDKVYMSGFEVIGSIKIPKTKLEIPILGDYTTKSLEVSVAIFDGPGLNEIGNTTIMGHNYRNGLFFSDNEKLSVGDKIYITDGSGTEIKYNIYKMYETDPTEAEYMRRDTNGKREISLSTCNDDSSKRLVIWAVEE